MFTIYQNKRHGASAEEPPSASAKKSGSGSFGGAGYKLGEQGDPSQAIPSSSAARGAEPEEREVTLRLWSSGFTIDNGELRAYTDPANMEFLNSIKRGYSYLLRM